MNPIISLFQSIRELIRKQRKIITIASIFLFVSLFVFKTGLRDIFFISLLFAIAMLSIIPKKGLRELHIEIEFALMSTVLIGIVYGPVFGAVFGIVVAAITEILAAHVDMETFFEIFGMGAIGFVSFFFREISIFAAGMLMTFLFLFITQAILFYMGDADEKGHILIHSAVYLFSNTLLFRFIAPLLLGLYLIL